MVLVLKTWTEHPLSVTHGSATVHLLKFALVNPHIYGTRGSFGAERSGESRHHDGHADALIALSYENGELVVRVFPAL